MASSSRVGPGLVAALATLAVACSGGGSSNSTGPSPEASATVALSATALASIPLPTAATPAGTREFEDSVLGIRFRYPSSYTGAQKADQGNGVVDVFFESEERPRSADLRPAAVTINVRIVRNDDGFSLEDWAAKGGTESSRDKVLNTSEATLGGERALRVTVAPGFEGPQANSIITYAMRGDSVYSVWVFPGSPAALEAHRAEYDAVVASFEFID